MPKIVHFEIPVDDPDRAISFYQEVFGWGISGFGDMPYWLVRAGDPDEPGADGALTARDELHLTPVLVAAVEDIDETLHHVEQAMGKVLQGKLPVPGVGWSAYFKDPEGNTIGIFQADPGSSDRN